MSISLSPTETLVLSSLMRLAQCVDDEGVVSRSRYVRETGIAHLS